MPHAQSLSISPVLKPKTASRHRNAYRQLVVSEAKVESQILRAGKVAAVRARKENIATTQNVGRGLTCLWAGCKARIPDGNALWNHIECVHKPLGDNEDSGSAESIYADDAMPLDVPTFSVCADKNEETEDEVEMEEVNELVEDYSDSDWNGSNGGHRKMKPQPHVERYQKRIRCQWQRCRTTIQFAGLKRHIESKHSQIRNTACPKGCGYLTNRPDMMPRHTAKCHYRGPRRNQGESDTD